MGLLEGTHIRRWRLHSWYTPFEIGLDCMNGRIMKDVLTYYMDRIACSTSSIFQSRLPSRGVEISKSFKSHSLTIHVQMFELVWREKMRCRIPVCVLLASWGRSKRVGIEGVFLLGLMTEGSIIGETILYSWMRVVYRKERS